MRALHRKLLRDLAQTWGQALSIALVVASGVAVLLASLSTQDALRRAQDGFYREARFAQVFAELKQAPQALRAQLEAVPGAAQVETRLSARILLDLPGFPEPIAGQLLSLGPSGQPRLNRLHLVAGRFPEPGRAGEVVVNEAFAEAHGLKPGTASRPSSTGAGKRCGSRGRPSRRSSSTPSAPRIRSRTTAASGWSGCPRPPPPRPWTWPGASTAWR